MRMKNILVVFNNKAGEKKASSYIKLIYKTMTKAKLNFKFVFISVLPFLSNVEKYDTVIVVGGDGTINGVLPLVVNTDKTLGIIPAGTANLLAANLLIPGKASKALKVILKAKSTVIDAAKADGRYFVLRLGFGYDAEILKSTPQPLKNKLGYLAYFLQGIIKFFMAKNAAYKIKLDNEKLFVSADTIIIANAGNMFKNIFTIAPNGTLDDGKFDVFIRRSRNFIDFIEVFLQIIFKNYKQNSKVIYTQASNILIKTKNKHFHIDGESCTLKNSLNIQIIPKAIKVLVP